MAGRGIQRHACRTVHAETLRAVIVLIARVLLRALQRLVGDRRAALLGPVQADGPQRLPDDRRPAVHGPGAVRLLVALQDRKSTRLNSSHPSISYAVFCLKKKKYIPPTLSTR